MLENKSVSSSSASRTSGVTALLLHTFPPSSALKDWSYKQREEFQLLEVREWK